MWIYWQILCMCLLIYHVSCLKHSLVTNDSISTEIIKRCWRPTFLTLTPDSKVYECRLVEVRVHCKAISLNKKTTRSIGLFVNKYSDHAVVTKQTAYKYIPRRATVPAANNLKRIRLSSFMWMFHKISNKRPYTSWDAWVLSPGLLNCTYAQLVNYSLVISTSKIDTFE